MTLFSIKQRSYRLKVRLLFTVILSLFITQYAPLYASRDGNRQGTTPTKYIPETPDYGDPTMWFTRENDSNDTGADVQYIKPVVCRPCVMCINPVNWRTDATPATLADTITVSVSPEPERQHPAAHSKIPRKPLANTRFAKGGL